VAASLEDGDASLAWLLNERQAEALGLALVGGDFGSAAALRSQLQSSGLEVRAVHAYR
jgi:hypothetical protein